MIYGEPKKLQDGRLYLKVSTDDGNRCMVQLNNSALVTQFTEGENITLSLSDKGLSKISAINQQNLTAAKENASNWFGREVADKTLQVAYTSSVSENTINVNHATVNKSIVTKCYDHQKNPADFTSLKENTQCDIILEFAGLWFLKKTFGPIWRLAQVRLKAPPKKLYPDEYMFNDSGSEAGDPEENDEDYM